MLAVHVPIAHRCSPALCRFKRCRKEDACLCTTAPPNQPMHPMQSPTTQQHGILLFPHRFADKEVRNRDSTLDGTNEGAGPRAKVGTGP